jgi:phosphoserine aminotransferase
MTQERIFNFSAGPSTLPLPALERARDELLNFEGSGMSIMEHSHRGKVYESMHDKTIALLTELLGIPDTHQVLFLQGGASQQFAVLPMNLRTDTHAGDYIVTGTWAQKAYEEAAIVGKPNLVIDMHKDGVCTRVPKQAELKLSANAPYVHMCSNNTIMGTQFHYWPETGNVPLICDMSSDIMSRPIDVSRFGMIYAGAQKNMGPAGVTIVIIRKDLLEKCRKDLPKIFRYTEAAKNNSLHNTAPTLSIYMVRNVLMAFKDLGGLPAIEKHNREKAALLYAAIDSSDGFYKCPVEQESRSLMNVVFRLPSEELEKKFVAESEKRKMSGLKGHRSVGGIRASIYNAMSRAGLEALVAFMADFKKSN